MLRLSILLSLASIRLSAQFNSIYNEQAPVLTPDGNEIYFTVSNHPNNVAGKSDPGDIWVSRWVDNQWSVPALANGSINNSAYNVVLGFSPDGQKMYLLGHYTYYGEPAGGLGISISKRVGGVWGTPQNEIVPSFSSIGVIGGHVTPDKTLLLFSAASQDSFGQEDIYVSFRVGTKWTEPKNLGPTINTKDQELTPWLGADTKTLYFASNTSASHGSFDIFSTERLDSTWTRWAPPRNLGTTINSTSSELFYSMSAGKILFTSTLNSMGYADIKESEVPVPIIPKPKKDSIPEPAAESEEVALEDIPDNG